MPPAAASSFITRTLVHLVSQVPHPTGPASSRPMERARAIAKSKAMKAAGISSAMALPPGPLGLVSIVPELLAIWHLQQSMVAEIAAAYGKSAFLRRETMIYCLFRHGGAALVRDLVVRGGERFLIRRAQSAAVQSILQKVGLRLSGKVIGKGFSRWVPVLGALGVGAYAYYDTQQVAATAIELFSKNLEWEKGGKIECTTIPSKLAPDDY